MTMPMLRETTSADPVLTPGGNGARGAVASWPATHLADVIDSIRRWGPVYTTNQRGLLNLLEAEAYSRSVD